jgi:hypothetical protein
MATTSETWFERVMWVGICANVALALPTLLWPAEMLAFSRLPDAIPLVWVRFSSLLLILLSSFYVPAALDCRRARVNAWLATAARLAGAIFFACQAREYWLFGAFDFAFFLPQALLLRSAGRVSVSYLGTP